MPTGRFPLALLFLACFLASGIAAAQWAQPTEAAALVRSPTLSPEARKAIQDRVDAVHTRFRETHGGLGPEQFGTQCCQITQIPAQQFTPLFGGTWFLGTFGYIYPVSGGSGTWSGVQLPSGVEIEYVDLYYYDEHGFYDIYVNLWAHAGGGPTSGAPSNTLLTTASSSGAPGYGYATSPFLFSHTVNNNVAYDPAAAQLGIQVVAETLGGEVRFKAVDLWWMRQVSPAPAAATFNDVPPSDSAFQFIEALAASGITAGCNLSPPLYCPDSPLTRRQMAVFLSKALGLYWPW